MFEIIMIMWKTVLALCSSVVGMDLLYKHKWTAGGIVMLVTAMAVVSLLYFARRLATG